MNSARHGYQGYVMLPLVGSRGVSCELTGIGLHGLLKSIQKPCHLKKFSGQTLGVDAYGWLHRGTVACSVDLVLDRPTRK
jgi:hypothetical protein